MNNRDKEIKKYGIEIVTHDEELWLKRGYKINYETGLLEHVNQNNN